MFLKFPSYFYDVFKKLMIKEKIIDRATTLFLNLGFKSVTMDDLASELGISKKTIYSHFQNKTKLIESTTDHLYCEINDGIYRILDKRMEPIEELFAIKAFVMQHLKNEKTSPQYQLQKYYPKIYSTLKTKQFSMMQKCVIENLERGIRKGFYRETLDTDIVSRFYFMAMTGIKDQELFPSELYPVMDVQSEFLEYHIRGIATSQGLKILDNLLTAN